MPDSKISALPSATTPLSGTEVLPVVQSGATDQVTVANLTAGRNVAMANATIGSGGTTSFSTSLTINGTNNSGNGTYILGQRNSSNAWFIGDTAAALGGGSGFINYIYGANSFYVYVNGSRALDVSGATSDTTFTGGNLVQATAAKGVNFTANSTGSGTMTSQLLNWYEEGNWTPTVTAGTGTITTVGAVSGKYTRIGRFISYYFNVVITTNGTGSNYVLVSNLPFATSGFAGSGTETAATGKMIQCFANDSTSIRLKFYDYTYPGSDGSSFNCVVNGYI